MKIKVSEQIGFCYGVKNAVGLSKKALEKRDGKVFSIGPIIHNPQVTEELQREGLSSIESADKVKEGIIIISSHGAGAKLKHDANTKGLKIIDATCPFVKKIQGHVKNLYKEGYKVIIVGKKEHPEVKSLIDFADGKALVIKDVDEARGIDCNGSKVGVVTQSTYSQKAFFEMVSVLMGMPFKEIRVFNTICSDTVKRQDGVRDLACSVDCMVIVGGRNSSNTRRLTEACKEREKLTYQIEDSNQINPKWIQGCKSIGIASGASTPDWVVRNVIDKISAFAKEYSK